MMAVLKLCYERWIVWRVRWLPSRGYFHNGTEVRVQWHGPLRWGLTDWGPHFKARWGRSQVFWQDDRDG